jgi:hypothetical protein
MKRDHIIRKFCRNCRQQRKSRLSISKISIAFCVGCLSANENINALEYKLEGHTLQFPDGTGSECKKQFTKCRIER